MLTEYEAWKLKDNARHELSVGPGVVSKCAVMLLLFIELAWIGASSGDPASRDAAVLETLTTTNAEP